MLRADYEHVAALRIAMNFATAFEQMKQLWPLVEQCDEYPEDEKLSCLGLLALCEVGPRSRAKRGVQVETVEKFRRVVDGRQRLLGLKHDLTLSSQNELGFAQRFAKKPSDALTTWDAVISACDNNESLSVYRAALTYKAHTVWEDSQDLNGKFC